MINFKIIFQLEAINSNNIGQSWPPSFYFHLFAHFTELDEEFSRMQTHIELADLWTNKAVGNIIYDSTDIFF